METGRSFCSWFGLGWSFFFLKFYLGYICIKIYGSGKLTCRWDHYSETSKKFEYVKTHDNTINER